MLQIQKLVGDFGFMMVVNQSQACSHMGMGI
jgi:hypothetical protein